VLFRRLEMLVLHMRSERFEKIREALAVLGADRDRLAQTKRIGFDRSRFGGAAFNLVGDDDDRRGFGPKPTPDFLIKGSETLARVDQQQGRVGVAHGRFGLRTHPAGQSMRFLVFEPGCVDDAKVKAKQVRIAFTPVASHARLVIDERKALADKPVEERRFADVGTADDRNGREGHDCHLPPPRQGSNLI